MAYLPKIYVSYVLWRDFVKAETGRTGVNVRGNDFMGGETIGHDFTKVISNLMLFFQLSIKAP